MFSSVFIAHAQNWLNSGHPLVYPSTTRSIHARAYTFVKPHVCYEITGPNTLLYCANRLDVAVHVGESSRQR